MKLENTQAQMRKGLLEYAILLLLQKKEMYPSDIIKALKAAKMIVVEGTLYPLLSRLKNASLLTYRWEESTQGPPRKYYVITENGKIFALELEKTFKELTTAIKTIEKSK